MAGGISQALVTTVLGLVVAIPLLFSHTLLSSRSRTLIQILDEQSAGLIASQGQGGSEPHETPTYDTDVYIVLALQDCKWLRARRRCRP